MTVGGKMWAWYLAHTVQSLLLRWTLTNFVCLRGPPTHIYNLTLYAKVLPCCLTRLTVRYMLPLRHVPMVLSTRTKVFASTVNVNGVRTGLRRVTGTTVRALLPTPRSNAV